MYFCFERKWYKKINLINNNNNNKLKIKINKNKNIKK